MDSRLTYDKFNEAKEYLDRCNVVIGDEPFYLSLSPCILPIIIRWNIRKRKSKKKMKQKVVPILWRRK